MIFNILVLIGSLGLFLYGMKLMSEALQKVAGNRLRSIMAAMTANRGMGILTGILVTAIIQSSSATTVMVVSFVNAGLMSLVQSISVVMGANIGTTVTAWIISIFGFKVNISDLSYPILAFALPLIFSKRNTRKNWGEFMIGFALLFMGLEALKGAVPDIKQNPEVLAFLANYTDLGFMSTLLFLAIGTILTIVVQSSSATMAITLIMCAQGWITFEIAAAMVLGENIGTTITANIAALSANVSAKRTALAHTLFNIFGVIWMLMVFTPFTGFIKQLLVEVGQNDPAQSNAFALSLFHTVFNLTNALILCWFVKTMANIVTKIIPQKHSDEESRLRYISTGMLSTSELSILQAQKEMYMYAQRVKRMFGFVQELMDEKNENQATKIFSRIEKYENISDTMEIEIANYLTHVSEGRLSNNSKLKIQQMLRIISEVESVADSCFNLAKTIERKRQEKVDFSATPELEKNINMMYSLVNKALDNMLVTLEKMDKPIEEEAINAENIEAEINNHRNELKRRNAADIREQTYPYNMSVIYIDLISEYEKLGDYIINIVEAVEETSAIMHPHHQ